MSNPLPVNVIISYDVDLMLQFQETKSFSILKQEMDKRDGDGMTSLFSVGADSNLLSLTHQYGGDQDSTIELKILDKNNVFSKDLFKSTKDIVMPSNSNLVLEALKTKYQEYYNRSQADGVISKEGWEGWFGLRLPRPDNLEDITLSELSKKLTTFGLLDPESRLHIDDAGFFKGYNKEEKADRKYLKLLKKLYMHTSAPNQRPLYITYGVGNNLKKWAPVQCFGKIVRANYSFDGAGVRILTLICTGKGISPNLTSAGITVMGSLGKGIITLGYSNPIFKKGDKVASKHAVIIGKKYKFSLHKVVTEAMTNFIKSGTNTENVLVILPNLDVYLKNYIKELVQAAEIDKPLWASAQNPASKAIRVARDALEGLGLDIATEQKGKGSSQTSLWTFPEFNIPMDDSPESIEKWLDEYGIRAVIQCDHVNQTIIQKLNNIATIIKSKMDGQDDAPKVEFMHPYVFSDFGALRVMHESGLIKTFIEPLILYGDYKTIDGFLFSRLFEEQKEHQKELKIEHEHKPKYGLKRRVNNYLKNRGLNYDHMERMNDYNKNSGNNPKFIYGKSNSNILSIDVDINNQYTNLINSTEASKVPFNKVTTALIPPNFVNQYNNMWKNIKGLDFTVIDDETKRPVGFDELMDTQFNITFGKKFSLFGFEFFNNEDKISSVGNVDDLENFNKLSNYFNPDIVDEDGADAFKDFYFMPTRESFYAYAWKMFESLHNSDFPKSVYLDANGNTAISAMKRNASIEERLSRLAYTAKIKTIPNFRLASELTAINRKCLIDCIEPTLIGNSTEISWFSGIYTIYGFKHTISKSSVESEFYVSRSTQDIEDIEDIEDEAYIDPIFLENDNKVIGGQDTELVDKVTADYNFRILQLSRDLGYVDANDPANLPITLPSGAGVVEEEADNSVQNPEWSIYNKETWNLPSPLPSEGGYIDPIFKGN
jgi:hypothetical protein